MELTARLAVDVTGVFPEVVALHQDLVFGVALRVVRRAPDAEDVAQEAFVRAYRALGRYEPARISKLHLRPWLARIALNAARNHLRRARTDEELGAGVEPAAPAAEQPVDISERREERRLWARLLAGLPERQRLAVALRHVEGLTYHEMAAALGRPLGTVKSDVHRGVRLLRAEYEAELRRIHEREAV